MEGRLTTVLRRTKTSGSRRIKELPVAISEHAYFLRSTWLRVGFDLLRTHANYKRDYLLPRLNLEKKPASYADAMVATAGLLGILGLPLEVQGYWTEHSERSGRPRTRTFYKDGSPRAPTPMLGPSQGGSPDSRHSSLGWPEGQIATIGWMSGRLRRTWFHG